MPCFYYHKILISKKESIISKKILLSTLISKIKHALNRIKLTCVPTLSCYLNLYSDIKCNLFGSFPEGIQQRFFQTKVVAFCKLSQLYSHKEKNIYPNVLEQVVRVKVSAFQVTDV